MGARTEVVAPQVPFADSVGGVSGVLELVGEGHFVQWEPIVLEARDHAVLQA